MKTQHQTLSPAQQVHVISRRVCNELNELIAARFQLLYFDRLGITNKALRKCCSKWYHK